MARFGRMSSRPAESPGVPVQCQGVVHIYRTVEGDDVVALSGVDLTIDQGERVALLGPSGSGKSTLLSLLGGVQRPSAGRVFIDHHDIARVSEPELARLRARRIGSLLQGAERNLLSYATTTQNLEFARRAVPSADRDNLVTGASLLELLGLQDLAHRRIADLSGGERQRVALASTLASNPGLLLADEPTSALGQHDRDAMVDLLERVGDQFGTTVVIVTHDPDIAARMQRSVTIRDGRVGSVGHLGEEYAVVAADGSLQLPQHIREDWPPGALIRFVEREGMVQMVRADVKPAEPDGGPP